MNHNKKNRNWLWPNKDRTRMIWPPVKDLGKLNEAIDAAWIVEFITRDMTIKQKIQLNKRLAKFLAMPHLQHDKHPFPEAAFIQEFVAQKIRDLRNYSPKVKAGRCVNGAERDHGQKVHAVPEGSYKALCGTSPGRTSAGWADEYCEPTDSRVTCPKCLSSIKAFFPPVIKKVVEE